jgi:hypothetical protein
MHGFIEICRIKVDQWAAFEHTGGKRGAHAAPVFVCRKAHFLPRLQGLSANVLEKHMVRGSLICLMIVFGFLPHTPALAQANGASALCRAPGDVWSRERVLTNLSSTRIVGRTFKGTEWTLVLDPSAGHTAPAEFTAAGGTPVTGSYAVTGNSVCQSYNKGASFVCHQIRDCTDPGVGPIMVGEDGRMSSQILAIEPIAPRAQLCREPGQRYFKTGLDTLVRDRSIVTQSSSEGAFVYKFLSDGTGARYAQASQPEQMQWSVRFAKLCMAFGSDGYCISIAACNSGEAEFVVFGDDGGQVGLVTSLLDLNGRPVSGDAVRPKSRSASGGQAQPATTTQDKAIADLARTKCSVLQSALERLDCYDSLFGKGAAITGSLPDTETLKADLIGQRLIDPNNNALGVGRRYFDIGSLSTFSSTVVLGSNVVGDIAEMRFGITLLDAGANKYYTTEVNMVYRRRGGQWVHANTSMIRNFDVSDGR